MPNEWENNPAPSPSVGKQARATSRATNRRTRAFVSGICGFLIGVVFWHFVGFWGFLAEVIIIGPDPNGHFASSPAAKAFELSSKIETGSIGTTSSSKVNSKDHGQKRKSIELANAVNFEISEQPLSSRDQNEALIEPIDTPDVGDTPPRNKLAAEKNCLVLQLNRTTGAIITRPCPRHPGKFRSSTGAGRQDLAGRSIDDKKFELSLAPIREQRLASGLQDFPREKLN